MLQRGEGGSLKSDVTFKGGHRKVTLGDKGGEGSQKSQNSGDVLYGRPQMLILTLFLKKVHSIIISIFPPV